MHFLLFLIHPLTMLIAGLKNLRGKHLPNVLWLFTIFYAMTIGVQEGSTADIVRYMAQLELFYWMSFDVATAVSYYQDSGEIDILRLLLAITVSRFTANGYILVIIYGIIFGYFFSRNFAYIVQRLQGKLQLITIILLILFFLLDPIWQINGFRFWTATHVFLYGLLPFLFEGNRRRLLWCVATPFIFHFSFLVPLAILLAYLVVGNRIVLYYAFFLLSIFISEINLEVINNMMEQYAPSKLADRTDRYLTESALEKFQERGLELSWHAKYYFKALRWALIALLIVLYWKSKSIVQTDQRLLRLLSFTFLLYGVANIFSNLPSGGRFVTLASMLAVALLAVYLQNNRQEVLMRRLIPWAYPLLGLYIIVAVRIGFYQMSVTTLLGNPLIALFTLGDNLSLDTLIK